MKYNKDGIKKDGKKDNFLIDLGKTLKNTAGFAVETANNFGTSLPFDLLRDFGVPIKETVFTPTAYNKKDYINMSVKDFIPNLLEGSANLVTGVLTDGLVNKGMSKASNFLSNKLSLLKNAKKVVNPVNKVVNKTDDIVKNSPNFKSEIDWSKWNKEIPNNKSLMQEYNAIEESTKKAGTWMKNPDGTNFKGTPEQFIQQKSSNFKKAFSNTKILDKYNNPQINYHGGRKDIDYFMEPSDPSFIKNKGINSGTGDYGIYFSGDKNTAKQYLKGYKKPDRQLYETYVNIENPYKTNSFFGLDIKQKFNKEYFNPRRITKYNINKISDSDGVIWKGVKGEIIPIKSNQIKSAIGNNGMFDMTNPNIYKSAVGLLGGSQLINNSNNKEKYTKGLSQYKIGGKLNNHTNINMKFNKEETKKFKKGEKKASRKERKYQKRSDAFNSALQNIENLRASGASASEIGVAQGNLGRLQNRLGADGLNRLREEQRTQAIARDVANTQARETVQANTGLFGSYQSPQVNVVMPTRTAQIAPVPQITPQTNLANHFRTRGEAFNYARKQGWKTFTYDDGKGKYKQFTTEVAVPASKTTTQQTQQTQQTQHVKDKYGNWITRPVSDRYGNIVQGPAAKSITNRQQHAIDVSRLPGGSEHAWVNGVWLYIDKDGEKKPLKARRYILPWGVDYTYLTTNDDVRFFQRKIHEGDTTYLDHTHSIPAASRLPSYKQIFASVDKKVWKARGYQQGGQLPGYQQGGTITKHQLGNPIWQQNIFDYLRNNVKPAKENQIHLGGQNYAYRYLTPRGREVTEITDPTSANSSTFIRQTVTPGKRFSTDGTVKNDTSRVWVNALTADDLGQWVRKKPITNRELNLFDNANKRLRQHQQGGAIEDLRINDEMMLEALFRYFQAKGVPQEALIDPETGSFNADYEPDATKFFQTVGEDTAFWSAYKSAPDKTIAEYIATENPESVEMAKKGAKLKKLQKYKKGNPIKKCSCGCDMITSREEGGKLVSKCACGCKN